MHPYGGRRARKFRCACDCGNTKLVWAQHLRSGNTRSCGCLCIGRKSDIPPTEAAIRFVVRRYKANAKNRGIVFDLADSTIRELLVRDCFYCGCTPNTVGLSQAGLGKFVYTGIDRINNELSYVPGNVVSCCSTCNRAKRAMGLQEFLDWVDRVYAHSSQKQNICRLIAG